MNKEQKRRQQEEAIPAGMPENLLERQGGRQVTKVCNRRTGKMDAIPAPKKRLL